MDVPKTEWAEMQAKLLLGSLLLMTGPVDHYDENVATAKSALLEADKNGYERGRKEDDELLREAFTRLEDFHPPTNETDEKLCGTCEFLGKLKARLAPSGSLSEGKEKPND